jgi:hypothetical protein
MMMEAEPASETHFVFKLIGEEKFPSICISSDLFMCCDM